jgi:ribosomal protein L32
MTPINFSDVYARVPGSDDMAWQPLSEVQRRGEACMDCGTYHGYPSREIGRCADGPLVVCPSCYVQRLQDHIDYYRPQS